MRAWKKEKENGMSKTKFFKDQGFASARDIRDNVSFSWKNFEFALLINVYR